MIKKTIAIDMDGVLADTEAQYIKWYERDYGVKIDRLTLVGIAEGEAFPVKDAIRKFLYTPGFFRTLPLISGAQAAVAKLMEDYDVYIVSAAMEFPQSLFEKREWLETYFPEISWKNIVFCGDKHIIDTYYLIDDHCKNLDFFKGKPIMFTAAHNVNFDHHIRVNNWDEVLNLFEQEALCMQV
jgi:5'-nucleotidase